MKHGVASLGYDYLENNKNKLSQELKDYIETDDPFGNRKKQ